MTSLVWLPGLDGLDGAHWAPLVDAMSAAERDASHFLALPPGPQGYDDLARALAPRLPSGPIVLLGESFSSPLAIRLAHRTPCVGLVLVAGFVTPPVPAPPALLRAVARCALRVPPPTPLLRLLLLGAASPAAVQATRALLRHANPDAMADRLAAVAAEQASDLWASAPCPAAYLHATGDGLLGARTLRDVRRARPDATVLPVDGPHLVLQIAPQASLTALRTLPFWPR